MIQRTAIETETGRHCVFGGGRERGIVVRERRSGCDEVLRI